MNFHYFKNFHILLLLFFSSFSTFGQSQMQIKRLINKISWSSISVDHSYQNFTLTFTNPEVKKLINMGPLSVDELIKNIRIPEKTVIIHMILTKIIDKDYKNDKLSLIYTYKNCNQLYGWHNVFNGLVWEWNEKTGETISLNEINKIEHYWKSKKNQNNITLNEDTIITKTIENDAINFPCNKIQDNNSTDIKSETLFNLLGKKVNDILFLNITNKLGNDSTNNQYNDCFFISYGPDGIDFRFDKDSVLTSIFIEPIFQGQMPYEIIYTDNMNTIQSKIGPPNKVSIFGKKEYHIYESKKLHIRFNNEKNIETFILVK